MTEYRHKAMQLYRTDGASGLLDLCSELLELADMHTRVAHAPTPHEAQKLRMHADKWLKHWNARNAQMAIQQERKAVK